MITEIGMDIIEIDRIEKALARRRRLQERLFSPGEIAYCLGKGRPAASFAARFAAKEAVRKSCGGDQAAPWREIEILSEGGKPRVRLSGSAAQIAGRLGIKDFLVSLTHCKTYACAVAVAIKE